MKKMLLSLVMTAILALVGSAVAQSSGSLVPPAGHMPNGNRPVYYANSSNHIISVTTRLVPQNSISRGGYWAVTLFVYKGGGPGTGYINYYELKSSQNGVWGYSQCDMFGRPQSGPALYVAQDWSYVKVGNDIYNIPISKEKFDSIQPRSRVYIGGNGGGTGGSGGTGSNYQTGPSHIDKACQYCGGGGGCRSCNGQGIKYNSYSGHHERCSSCNGSGRCFNCRGTGKQATY